MFTRKQFDDCMKEEIGMIKFSDGTRGTFRATADNTVKVFQPQVGSKWSDVLEYALDENGEPYVVTEGVEPIRETE